MADFGVSGSQPPVKPSLPTLFSWEWTDTKGHRGSQMASSASWIVTYVLEGNRNNLQVLSNMNMNMIRYAPWILCSPFR